MPPANRPNSASTTATTPDGELTIRGIDGDAWHVHGGSEARLGLAKFYVANRARQRRTLQAEAVEFLFGHSCEAPPADVRARPRPAGLFVEDSAQRESTPTITVAAGATATVLVGFAPDVGAYYTYCERFAFRVRFLVDGKPIKAVAETWVTREEPLRESPQ